METSARQRLSNDFRNFQENPIAGITAVPKKDNILSWYGVIIGLSDTPFEDGTFKLKLEFSEEYPIKPPKIRFLTPIFHPNIYEDGTICIDMLKDCWNPAHNIQSILAAIQLLLSDPNLNSPANAVAALLYTKNPREYEKRVLTCVERSFYLTQ